MVRHLCLLFALLSLLSAQGQSTADGNVRHASGKGPFPFFITTRFCATSNVQDLRTIGRSLNGAFERADRKFRMQGMGFTFGGIVSAKHRPLQRMVFEGGYTKVGRSLSGVGSDSTFKWREETISLRMGPRFTPFYPVNIVLYGGVFYHYARTMALEGPDPTHMRRLRAEYPFRYGSFGVEAGARLLLLDATGSGGGLGLFLEMQAIHELSGQRLEPFFTMAHAGRVDVRSTARLHMVQYSIGVTVPLALRMR
jgi:hypothetical protein